MRSNYSVRSTRLGALGLTGTLAVGGLIGLAVRADAVSCEQTGTLVTCTFNDPNTMERWEIPAGITSATVTVAGGAGGDGAGGGGQGGVGGVTTTTLGLTPGTKLDIYVGGAGGDGPGCSAGPGGTPGMSGGIQTGGKGGLVLPDAGPAVCAGGGGGGGTFVMDEGQTLDGIAPYSSGTVPLLVAGGGGGGGGGVNAPASNGGNGGSAAARATNGCCGSNGGGAAALDSTGGENSYFASTDGDAAYPPDSRHAGGGGGGGYGGGGKGNANCDGGGGPLNGPGCGGGGGGGLPTPEAPAMVPSSVQTASVPARVVGPTSYGLGGPGEPGSVSITYSLPAAPSASVSPTDKEQCQPSAGPCVVNPPPGQQSEFQVTGFGGKDGATLIATLNGGPAPTCKSVGGTLAPDWVQFGFANPKDGRTWSKKIQETGIDPTSKEQAQRILAQTQICFAAPYKFVVKRGEQLTRTGGHWEGLLAHCKSRIIAEAKAEQPDLARPCILNRALVQKGDGYVVQVNYFVPNGELDPQGRSLRKKKKQRH
jgi:hypothetical protein